MDLSQALNWLLSGDGRLIAAAAIVLVMWALKSIPAVEEKILTTPRRRQLAVAFLALMPAVTLLVSGAPIKDVVVTAGTLFLAAMGIHTGAKVAQGKAVGVDGAPPSTEAGGGPPVGPTAMLGVLALAMLLSGCGASASPSLEMAFAAAGAAVEVERHVGDTVKRECTDAADKVKSEAELDAIQADCMPAIRILAALRTGNLATQAALTAAVAEGDAAKALVAVKGIAVVAEAAATTAAALEK